MADIPLIVCIDGPAGVGKSTLARRVAEALGIAYLDTGAMFRTIALKAAELPTGTVVADVGPPSGQSIVDGLHNITFSLKGEGSTTSLLCNGVVVGQEVRSEKAGMMAAKVAALPEVRALLKKSQQELGRTHSLVAEGRDMGTVIFPMARYKIFLDASVEERAERRYKQLTEMGEPGDLQQIFKLIRLRDEQDRNRPIAPLKAAHDAVTIDTSCKNMDEVFADIMNTIAAKP